jgi:hypothetical protein
MYKHKKSVTQYLPTIQEETDNVLKPKSTPALRIFGQIRQLKLKLKIKQCQEKQKF